MEIHRFEETFGSTRLALHCSPVLESYAHGALRALGARIDRGFRVAPGQTFDFCGMVFSIQKEPGGLIVSRPVDENGTAFLGEGTDLTNMLGVVALQYSLMQEVGVEPVPSSLFDIVVIEQGMHEVKDVYMHRTATDSPGDTGWFIATEGYEPGRPVQSVQVLQLFRVRRSLLWALTLPTDYLAFFDGDELVRVVDPADRVFELRKP